MGLILLNGVVGIPAKTVEIVLVDFLWSEE